MIERGISYVKNSPVCIPYLSVFKLSFVHVSFQASTAWTMHHTRKQESVHQRSDPSDCLTRNWCQYSRNLDCVWGAMNYVHTIHTCTGNYFTWQVKAVFETRDPHQEGVAMNYHNQYLLTAFYKIAGFVS